MCVHIHHICRETSGINIRWNMSSSYFNTAWCLLLSQVIPTSADRASRRPAASSRVPRAWVQGGRYSQWDSKPHWYPYSHSGRQCSPLTTHVPRGVRNPESTTHTKSKWTHGTCEWSSAAQYIDISWSLTVCHDGLYESRAAGEAVLPVVTSGVVVTHEHAPLQRRHQPTPL